MARFRAEETRERRLGRVCVLADDEHGSEAKIALDRGANLFSLKVPVGKSAEPVNVLLGPGPGRDPMHFGIPILFPFPNRIRAGRFKFRGKSYQLDLNAAGNAIHGLVRGRAWSLESTSQSNDGARIVARFDSRHHPSVTRQFPFPFVLDVEFTVSGNVMAILARATNAGEDLMPMGFGLHPWFRLPLLPGGDRTKCELRVPASMQWKLDREKIPTGEKVPVPPAKDFREERPLGNLHLDDVYTDIESPGECTYRDHHAGLEVAIRYDQSFRELVIYAPPHTPTLCTEPYTCPTDAFNLTARGIECGVVDLGPGKTWTGRVEMHFRPTPRQFGAGTP